MTLAVCLQCGELKHGAFNPCPKCGYTPNDDESLTKHLLVTDHYYSHEALEAISARVKAGEPVSFDPESLQRAWVTKAQLDAQVRGLGWECMIFFVVLLMLILAAIGLTLFWRP